MHASRSSRSPWALLAVLAVFDVLLLAGNALHVEALAAESAESPFAAAEWNGDRDHSYIEYFGHVQGLFAVGVLGAVWWHRQAGIHVVWALTLLVMVADDYLQVHERVGGWLVAAWDLPSVWGLRPQDLGELAVWAGFAVVLGPALVIAHLRAKGNDRRGSWLLAGVVVVLAGFAVVLDMVAVAVKESISGAALATLTATETAGELVAMTLFVVVAAHLLVRAREARGVQPLRVVAAQTGLPSTRLRGARAAQASPAISVSAVSSSRSSRTINAGTPAKCDVEKNTSGSSARRARLAPSSGT